MILMLDAGVAVYQDIILTCNVKYVQKALWGCLEKALEGCKSYGNLKM